MNNNILFDNTVKWLRNNGGYLNEKLERKCDQDGVYGLYATEPIQAGEILCKVPENCSLSDTLHDSPDEWNRKIKLTYSILKEYKKGTDSFFVDTISCMTTMEEFRGYHPFYLDDAEHELLEKLREG